MPSALIKEFSGGLLALWDIRESEDELLQVVSESDRSRIADFKYPGRRVTYLSVRGLLNEILPGWTINYDDHGAPYLTSTGNNDPDKINCGISHTDSVIGIIVSTEGRCAMDIESVNRNFEGVAERFVSDAEKTLFDGYSPFPYVEIWCGKETLYKLNGRKGVDLIRDISIRDIDRQAGTISGAVADRRVDMEMFHHHDFLIVYSH